MRLKDSEVKVIKNSILEKDNNARIYLFGSRVDDNKKGGDIDILVLSNKLSYSDTISIKRKIFDEIDEQKIDIVIKSDVKEPFIDMIYKKSIQL